MGGGGSGAPTTSTTNTTNLPEYARPYFERLLDRTEAASNRNYESYTGPRIAGFGQDQGAGFQAVRNIANQGAPDLNYARGATDAATTAGLGTTGYRANEIGVDRQFGGDDASRYMSPYMQNVIERAQAGARREFAEGQAQRDDPAIRSGAYGGYRAAIQQGVAERGLSNQLADIEARGLQSAYENAQQQYERDRAAGFTVDSANEANRARAAGVQQQGAALGYQGAQTYANLGNMDQTMALQRAQALTGVGDRQQQLYQQSLDTAYQDFINQRDFERQQLNFYSGILRGVPVSAQSEVSQYTNPNPMNQLMGLGVAGLGAYRAMS